MKDFLIIAAIAVPIGWGIGTVWKHLDSNPKNCYTFAPVQTSSHIRLNSCTGEAHMVFKDGKGGFEWVRVNDGK